MSDWPQESEIPLECPLAKQDWKQPVGRTKVHTFANQQRIPWKIREVIQKI